MDPFNSPPSSVPAPTSGPPCPSCQQPMDPSEGVYDASGQLVCRRCNAARVSAAASASIQAADPSTNRNLYGAAAVSAGLGMMTCLLSVLGELYFLLAPVAVIMGGGALLRLFQRPGAREELGAGFFLVIAGCAAGILFGSLAMLIGALMLGMS